MLPVVDPSGDSTVRQILFYSLVLIPISLLPRYLGMSGNVYLAGALILGGIYFYSGLMVARELSRAHARRVLLASIIYLPVLYGLMMADRTSLGSGNRRSPVCSSPGCSLGAGIDPRCRRTERFPPLLLRIKPVKRFAVHKA